MAIEPERNGPGRAADAPRAPWRSRRGRPGPHTPPRGGPAPRAKGGGAGRRARGCPTASGGVGGPCGEIWEKGAVQNPDLLCLAVIRGRKKYHRPKKNQGQNEVAWTVMISLTNKASNGNPAPIDKGNVPSRSITNGEPLWRVHTEPSDPPYLLNYHLPTPPHLTNFRTHLLQ